VIVQGRLKQRSFETREGEKRTVVELEADEVGASLRSATAKVSKASRSGNGSFGGGAGSGGGGGGGGYSGGGAGAGSPGAGSAGPSDDPWSSSAGNFSEEPPF
jgi:single-strand DNA-binding protein